MRSRITRNNVFLNTLHQSPIARLVIMTEADGARTSIYAATAPELEGVTGRYFDKAKESKPNKATGNEEAARHLWHVSQELVDEAATPWTGDARHVPATFPPGFGEGSRLGLPPGPVSTRTLVFIGLLALALGGIFFLLQGCGDAGRIDTARLRAAEPRAVQSSFFRGKRSLNRSARVAMVSAGFTPTLAGMTEASVTKSPG